MPCYDPRDDRDRKHGDKAVRLLCDLCRELAARDIKIPILGLDDWLAEHRRIDEEDNPIRRL